MREELLEKLTFLLSAHGVVDKGLISELVILLNDYDVQKRATEVALRTDGNGELVKRFLMAKLVEGRSDRTVEYYGMELRSILDKIGKPVEEVTTNDVRYYMAVRDRRDHVSAVTRDNERRCLRSFYAWLVDEGLVARNPMARLDVIKGRKEKKKAFTEMEVERMRDACKGEKEKAVFELLLSTGCRVSELAGMKLQDVEGNHVRVLGKGNKVRNCYLNAKAQVALMNYMDKREDGNGYLFAGRAERQAGKRVAAEDWWKHAECVDQGKPTTASAIESMVRNLGKRAGVPNAHPHRFRRTCATMALRRGMPLELVSKMLGHDSIGTTQVYLDMTEGELESAHGKYVVI